MPPTSTTWPCICRESPSLSADALAGRPDCSASHQGLGFPVQLAASSSATRSTAGRVPAGLWARIIQRLLALNACIWRNWLVAAAVPR